ncbi:unnamed protein product [Vicia faba]|uniref:Uncharacterized protein n=1 Tax=Vicia faba TaxID=3906 RepID=A0AAV1B3N5_VICFA|nr:unnamed protein product [Vicia faba]
MMVNPEEANSLAAMKFLLTLLSTRKRIGYPPPKHPYTFISLPNSISINRIPWIFIMLHGLKFWFNLDTGNLNFGILLAMGLEGEKLPRKLPCLFPHDSVSSIIYVMEETILQQLLGSSTISSSGTCL